MFLINAKRHGRMDMNGVSRSILGSLMLLGLGGATITYAQQSEMTFFVTSAGPGKGGDFAGSRGRTRTGRCSPRPQERGARPGTRNPGRKGPGPVNGADAAAPGPCPN